MKSGNAQRALIAQRTRPSRMALLTFLALIVVAGRTASALTINLTFDTDANLAAAGLTAQNIVDMKAACQAAAKLLTDVYTRSDQRQHQGSRYAGHQGFWEQHHLFHYRCEL